MRTAILWSHKSREEGLGLGILAHLELRVPSQRQRCRIVGELESALSAGSRFRKTMLGELNCAQLAVGGCSFFMLRLQFQGLPNRLLRQIVIADVAGFAGFQCIGASETVVVDVILRIPR